MIMMFLLETSTTPVRDPTLQWVLIVLALVTIFYVTIIRPAAAKKKKDPLAKPANANSLAYERNVERQMQNLLVELSEMARQITAQLDTRAQKLQMLIQDADERIAVLGKADRQTSVPAEVVKVWAPLAADAEPVQEVIPPEPVDEQHQQVYTLCDRGKSAMDIARELNRPRGEVELILALRPTASRA